MNETDKVFVNMIHGMDAKELELIQQQTFTLEVTAVAKELTDIADSLCTHFDPWVVAAALSVVLDDYERHTDEKVNN